MVNLHKAVALAGSAALALAVGGCDRLGHHRGDWHGHHAKADVGAIKDAIKADETKWNDEFHANPKSVDALVAHYAPDAFFIVPGMAHASGSAAIRKGYEEAVKDPNFYVDFASDKVDVADSGDLAYSRGHFSEKYTNPKTKQIVSDGGSYITVYRKQSDGSWKAAEDFTAIEPAAAAK